MPSTIRILVGRSARFLYRRLPLPLPVKWRIKSFLYRRLGRFLRSSANYQQWLVQTAANRPATVKMPDMAPTHPLPSPPPMVEIGPEGAEGLAARLAFAAPDDPLVSIIIPAYNYIDYTIRCLASIHRHPPEASCELIVVDDASGDTTERLLGTIPGLRYFRNAENLGFLHTANHGAAQARGRYLLFLNNDTQTLPGWLDRLLEVFATHPDAGIVGAKLIYPSGHLQEAGAALRRDGTVDFIGLNDDPAKPQYNILREVDHCSGACVLIEAALFRELRGFDEIYAPAYFEDCDLSLRARARGRKVIYQPAAQIVHHLNVTNQNDHKLRQIECNKQIYLERWSATLEALDRVRLIAFYLPQYHPIPENDHWWGKGFTEWTNVTKAVPNFVGHYQPRLPADLGFYDLRVPEVREEQVALARQYGVYGFCYYYYWFAGKRLLNRPLDEVVESGRPDFPFCVCWANENWSRRWDGLDAEILIAQEHSDEDDLNFIKTLEPALRDSRYIRIDGRPLLLVYRPSLLPDATRTAEIWHGYCRETGLGELYLVAVQSFGVTDDPRGFGFDAAVEFPPHAMAVLAEPPAEMLNPDFRGRFYDYVATAEFFMNRPPMPYPFFRAAMPSWDNTARRQDNGDIFLNTAPEHYGRWLKHLVAQTRKFQFGDQRVVFVNAWNEWAEGNCLEPDRKFGRRYLEATKDALFLHSQGIATAIPGYLGLSHSKKW